METIVLVSDLRSVLSCHKVNISEQIQLQLNAC